MKVIYELFISEMSHLIFSDTEESKTIIVFSLVSHFHGYLCFNASRHIALCPRLWEPCNMEIRSFLSSLKTVGLLMVLVLAGDSPG